MQHEGARQGAQRNTYLLRLFVTQSDNFKIEPLLAPPLVLDLYGKIEADPLILEAVEEEDNRKRRDQHERLQASLQEASHRAGADRPPPPPDHADGATVKIWCGTWNLGGVYPQLSLAAWIPRGDFDMYAIGQCACGLPCDYCHMYAVGHRACGLSRCDCDMFDIC